MRQGENEEALQGLTSTIGTNISEGAYKTDSLFSSACIYRVPKELRKVKESAYTPRLIAIGPLHQKAEHLITPFQGVKKSYTNCLLLRLTAVKMEGSETKYYEYPKVLQECVKEMKYCVDKAKKCYAEELDVSDDHMSEMMLVDGCFILELFYKSFDESKYIPREAKNIPKEEGQEGKRNGASTSSDLSTPPLQMALPRPVTGGEDSSSGEKQYVDPILFLGKVNVDPILDNILSDNIVKQDLILLENQIPYFVLQRLFQLTVARIPNGNTLSLVDYVLSYFLEVENCGSETKTSSRFPKDCVLWVSGQSEEIEQKYYFHILHLLQGRYSPGDLGENFQRKDSTKVSEFKVSAADLHNAGVEFKVSAADLPYAGFEFLHHPSHVYVREPQRITWWFIGFQFYIPSFPIQEPTEVFLRNLIALEQCCPQIPRNITSYAKVMSMLINSEKDVQVLKDAGIIHNYLGTDKDVLDLFDKLCKGVTVQGDCYLDACQQAIDYYHQRNRWWRAMRYWRRLFYSSTWGVLAFALGIITSLITVAQFVRDFRK